MHLKDTQKISPTVSGKFFCSVYALGPAATTSALMWVYFLKFSTKLAASFVENFKKYTHMSAEVVAAGPKA